MAAGGSATDVREIVRRVEACVVVIRTETALGSGFLISADGLLVTNQHVVAGARSAAVRLRNGDVYDQVWKVVDEAAKDFAVLRIAGFGLPSCALADSSEVEVGQEVIAIGNPHGLDFTVSTGIVSAVRGDLAGQPLGYQVIQTTAPISPGSSGGPLLDAQGRVIGITTFQLTTGENLNFAVPINYVRGAIIGLEESERRGQPMGKLAYQTPGGRKTTISFRDLAWRSPLAEIERRLGVRVRRDRKPPDPLRLGSLDRLSTFSFQDSLLSQKVEVQLWLDPQGLAAVSMTETQRAVEATIFLRDLLSALGRNYGQPEDGAADETGLWALWTDGAGNALSLEVSAARCGRLPLPRTTCYAIELHYLRSDIAAQISQRQDNRLDPF